MLALQAPARNYRYYNLLCRFNAPMEARWSTDLKVAVRASSLPSCCFLGKDTSLNVLSPCPDVYIGIQAIILLGGNPAMDYHPIYDNILSRFMLQKPGFRVDTYISATWLVTSSFMR